MSPDQQKCNDTSYRELHTYIQSLTLVFDIQEQLNVYVECDKLLEIDPAGMKENSCLTGKVIQQ